MTQTLRDVATELELFEYSGQYLELLREEAEISLIDQYLEAQKVMLEMTVRPYLTEGYLIAEASEEQVKQVEASNEKRKSSFKGKIVSVLLKAYRFVVKFLRKIHEAWTKLFTQRKGLLQQYAKKGKVYSAGTIQGMINRLENLCNTLQVYPFQNQPFAKMVSKSFSFSNDVSSEMQAEFCRYMAFGIGDIILIKSNGDEIQMDVGTKITRQQGLVNDKVDDLANEKVIADLKERANKEGIRVELTGDHFKKTIDYYEKMVDVYSEKGTKYTVDQNTKEIAADMKGNERAKQNAQAESDRINGRSKACMQLSAALSKTCKLIEAAHKFQVEVYNLITNQKKKPVPSWNKPVTVPAEEESQEGTTEEPKNPSSLDSVVRRIETQINNEPNWQPLTVTGEATKPEDDWLDNSEKKYGLENPNYNEKHRIWLYNQWFGYYKSFRNAKHEDADWMSFIAGQKSNATFLNIVKHTVNAFGPDFQPAKATNGALTWMKHLRSYLGAFHYYEKGGATK